MPATEKSSTPSLGKPVGEVRSVDERDLVEKFLCELLKELLNLDKASVEDDFFDLGGDSMTGVQLFRAIQKEYGIEFGLSLLFDARTIRHLAECICKANRTEVPLSTRPSLVVPLQPRGTRLPLFWIPGGLGNSVLEFKQISMLLGNDQPVYGFEVQPPEEDQELESIECRATRLIEAMRTVQPEGPYRLVGFCAGGLVVFEMAQQLSLAGEHVQFLGIIDCVDPQHPRSFKKRVTFNAERMVWRTRQALSRDLVGSVKQLLRRLKLFRRKTVTNLVHLQESPADNPLRLTPPVLDNFANQKAARNAKLYFPKAYGGSCVIFIGVDTYYYAGLSAASDPRLVWRKLSEGSSQIRAIPGDHLTMLREPNVFEFAEQLKQLLQ